MDSLATACSHSPCIVVIGALLAQAAKRRYSASIVIVCVIKHASAIAVRDSTETLADQSGAAVRRHPCSARRSSSLAAASLAGTHRAARRRRMGIDRRSRRHLTIVMLIFGEVVPKSLGALYAERSRCPPRGSTPLSSACSTRITWLANRISTAVLTLLRPTRHGRDPTSQLRGTAHAPRAR